MGLANQVVNSNILVQGEVALFFWRQDDLDDLPTFVGLFSKDVIDGLTQPLGDLNPVHVPSPNRFNKFDIARITRSAPDLGEMTINERISRNALSMLEQVSRLECPIVVGIKIGKCGRPDDWDDFADAVMLVETAFMSELDYGTLDQFDANDPVETSGTFSHLGVRRYLAMRFQEEANTLILAEVIDVLYANEYSCGSCAPFDGGCDTAFALTRANPGSPGLSSQIVVTRDGFATETKYDIAALGGLSGSAMTAVGSKIVVVSEAFGGHVYAPKSDVSAGQWVAVTTGYQAGGSPRCIHSIAPQRTFIGGAGGYIYKLTSPTAGVEVVHDGSLTAQNTNAIHGVGEIVVSVHDSNAILLTSNGGDTWSLIIGPSVGDNLTAVWVINENQFYVGNNQGELWYTKDGGTNWTQRNLPGQASITAIEDIKFIGQHGSLAIQKTLTAQVLRSLDGGRNWYDDDNWITQLSTAPERINKVAMCGAVKDHILAGGLKAGSTDGILAVAE